MRSVVPLIGTHEGIPFLIRNILDRTNVSMDRLNYAHAPRERYRATHENKD